MQSAKDSRDKYTVIKKKFKQKAPTVKPYQHQEEGRVRVSAYEFQIVRGHGSADELGSPLTAAEGSHANTSAAADGQFKLYKMKRKRKFFNAVSNEFEEGEDEGYTQLSMSNVVRLRPQDIRCDTTSKDPQKQIGSAKLENWFSCKPKQIRSQNHSNIEEKLLRREEYPPEGGSPLLQNTPNNSILVSFCTVAKPKRDSLPMGGPIKTSKLSQKNHNFARLQASRIKQAEEGLKRTNSLEGSWTNDLLLTKATRSPATTLQRCASSNTAERSSSQTGSATLFSVKHDTIRGSTVRTGWDTHKAPWTEETAAFSRAIQQEPGHETLDKYQLEGSSHGSFRKLRVYQTTISHRKEPTMAQGSKPYVQLGEVSQSRANPRTAQNSVWAATKEAPVVRMLSSKHQTARLTVGPDVDFAASIQLPADEHKDSVRISASIQQSGLHMRRLRSSHQVGAVRAYRTPGVSADKKVS